MLRDDKRLRKAIRKVVMLADAAREHCESRNGEDGPEWRTVVRRATDLRVTIDRLTETPEEDSPWPTSGEENAKLRVELEKERDRNLEHVRVLLAVKDANEQTRNMVAAHLSSPSYVSAVVGVAK